MTSPITATLTRPLTYSLTKPLGTIMGQGGGLPFAFRHAASQGIDSPTQIVNTTGHTGVLLVSRSKIRIGVHCSEIWVGYPGYKTDTASTTANETAATVASPVAIQGSLSDGTNHPLGKWTNTVGDTTGSTTGTLNVGGIVWAYYKASDFGLTDFYGLTFFSKFEQTFTAGDLLIYTTGFSGGVTGEACKYVASSNLAAGGYAGGTDVTARIAPVTVLAFHNQKAHMFFGDSIGHGQANSASGFDSGEGTFGFMARAAYSAGLPFCKYTSPGNYMSGFAPGLPNMIALMAYGSDAWIQLGINDIRSRGDSAATVLGNLVTFCATIKAANPTMKTHALTVLLSAQSTSDSVKTAAGQTLATAFIYSAGHTVYDYNQLILAGGNAGVDTAHDARPGEEDPVAPGKFNSDGVTNFLYVGADLIHPSGGPTFATTGHFTLGISFKLILLSV